MEIIKGLDRIALVLAIIAMVFGGGAGYSNHQEIKKTETPKYQAWAKKYDINPGSPHYGEVYDPYRAAEPLERGAEPWERPPSPRYKHPPFLASVLFGLLYASISFVVVLFGFRGMTRGIKWFSLWIIDGFKNKKKE